MKKENLFNSEKMNVVGMYGYEFKTSFWRDFTIAEICGGETAIRETYNRAMAEWKDDHIYLTELVLVLNWHVWWWYDRGNNTLSMLYEELWNSASEYAMENLVGEGRRYYFATTD